MRTIVYTRIPAKINLYKFCNLLIISIFVQNINAQEKYMDYAITQENDTIYGLIRESGINNIALFTKNTNPDLDGIKFYSNNLKKVKEIRWNDAIYIFQESSKEDGIYASPVNHNKKGFITKIQGNFINHSPRLKDYIISENDTIYGVINDRRMGKAVLKDDSNNKIKIDIENIKSYRHNNDVFVVKEKKRVELFDDKIAYLKILLDGPIKYYEYMMLPENKYVRFSAIKDVVKTENKDV